MKSIVISLLSVALSSCASPRFLPRSGAATPDLSVIHLSGKITYVPPHSKWPASIKEGSVFDYWAVVDNRVGDDSSSPHQGSFPQKAWPSRYDLKIGEFRFSSDRLTPPTFAVTIYDGMPSGSDGYAISSHYYTSLPEAPALESVSFQVSLRTGKQDQIITDQLPVRPIPVADLVEGNAPNFGGYAEDKADRTTHSFHGKVEKFEVFQASADSPLSVVARGAFTAPR